MGASWVEVDTMIRRLDRLAEFPHAEALPAVTSARNMIAEAAMLVSRAAVLEDAGAERAGQDLLARTRVALSEAEMAVQRAREAVELCRATRDRAFAIIAEARALRARDR